MKFYISFGQAHAHSINGQTFDKDSLMAVEASDEIDARIYVNAVTGGRWSSLYYPDQLPEVAHYFPRGVINADKPLVVENIIDYDGPEPDVNNELPGSPRK